MILSVHWKKQVVKKWTPNFCGAFYGPHVKMDNPHKLGDQPLIEIPSHVKLQTEKVGSLLDFSEKNGTYTSAHLRYPKKV